MASEFSTCGGSHLARKSEIVSARAKLGALRDVLVVEDDPLDAERMTATLHVIFGYELRIHLASTLGDAVDRVIESKPSLVFLDDILKPSTNALQAIPLLRGAGYAGPIIVVSGQVTLPAALEPARQRRGRGHPQGRGRQRARRRGDRAARPQSAGRKLRRLNP